MKQATWIDKSAWGDGPWQSEPDRVEFEHADFVCVMKRHEHLGHWCGYVGVAPGHPWHGKSYDDVVGIDVHGNCTYGETCDGNQERGVCHVPKPGTPDHLWWIGFDFAHGYDLSPGAKHRALGGGAYRDRAYVEAECRKAAEQAAALEVSP